MQLPPSEQFWDTWRPLPTTDTKELTVDLPDPSPEPGNTPQSEMLPQQQGTPVVFLPSTVSSQDTVPQFSI